MHVSKLLSNPSLSKEKVYSLMEGRYAYKSHFGKMFQNMLKRCPDFMERFGHTVLRVINNYPITELSDTRLSANLEESSVQISQQIEQAFPGILE